MLEGPSQHVNLQNVLNGLEETSPLPNLGSIDMLTRGAL